MKRPFVPDFINRFDRNLLLNKPNTWSARIHFVVYFSMLFMLIVAALSFFAFSNIKEYSDSAIWTSLTALLCFIGLIIWLIYLLRFNVFKRFGKQSSTAGIKTFLLFFTGMSFLVLPAFVPMLVESFRANQRYSSNELVKDINSINKNILLLNYEMLSKDFNVDTIVMAKREEGVKHNNNAPVVQTEMEANNPDAVTLVKNNDRKIYLTVEDYKQKFKSADSSKLISDSMFVQFTAPDYAFVYNESFKSHATEKMLNHIELYNAFVKDLKPFDKQKMNSELTLLLDKSGGNNNRYEYYTADDGSNYYVSKISRKYGLGNISSGMYNISDKKYRWDLTNFGIYFRVFFYCAFVLTLLLFIFRHSTTRTFFLTLLTGIVLFILSAIIISFGRWESYHIFILMLVYYIAFAILSFRVFHASKRQLSHGIGLNIIAGFTAFVPLIILAIIDSYTSHKHRYDLVSSNNDFSDYYKYAEIGGVLLFVILLQPIIKKAYRKWYALPEN